MKRNIPLKVTVTSIGLIHLAFPLQQVKQDMQSIKTKNRKIKKQSIATLNGCLLMIQNSLEGNKK